MAWLVGKGLRRSTATAFMALASVLIPYGISMAHLNRGFHSDAHEVLKEPDLYIVYWGREWQTGFTVNGKTNVQYRTYLENFVRAISGGPIPYLARQSQYDGATPPRGIKGTWVDPDLLNFTLSEAGLQNEVRQAQTRFGDIAGGTAHRPDGNAIFLIATPPGHPFETNTWNGFCAYHSSVPAEGSYPKAATIALPYIPEMDRCFNNELPRDAFGHGDFDGVSKVVAHELAETITNPYGTGWADPGNPALKNGIENADICNSDLQVIGGSGGYYVAQTLHSNFDGGCSTGLSPRLQIAAPLRFPDTLVGESSAVITATLHNVGNAWIGAGPGFWSVSPSTDFVLWTTAGCYAFPAPGQWCNILVKFVPSTAGIRTATLTYRNGTASASTQLEGQGVLLAQRKIIIEPLAPEALVGYTSRPSVHIINPTDKNQRIHEIFVNGADSSEYRVNTTNRCPDILGAFADCWQQIDFTPSVRGQRHTMFSVKTVEQTDSGPIYPEWSASMSGVGYGSSYTLESPRLKGTWLNAGDGHAMQTLSASVTLRSIGDAGLFMNSFTVDGDFRLGANGCESYVAQLDSCVIQIVGNPTRLGGQVGTLTIGSDATDSLRTVQIFGTLTEPFILRSHDKVAFGDLTPGETRSVTVRLIAGEADDLEVENIWISGSSIVSQANDCPTNLWSACAITVRIDAASVGTVSGTLHVVTNTSQGEMQIPITAEVVRAATTMTAEPAIAVPAQGSALNVLNLSARLAGPGDAPITGQTISFRAGGSALCTAVTDQSGRATCSALDEPTGLPQMIIEDGYTASFAGSTTLLPSSAHGRLLNIGGTELKLWRPGPGARSRTPLPL